MIVAAGCGRPAPPGPPRPDSRPAQAARDEDLGLRFRLTPGSKAGAAGAPHPKARTSALDPSRLKTLLAALPPLAARPTDRQDFALRERSLPPPRTARTLDQPFPPPHQRPTPQVAVEKVQVQNIAPRGEVEMAPHLTVTFNQPMVPLTTLKQLESKQIPVTLKPQPPGKWRWLGTQVLMFVPDLRFPMATHYEVEVPAGVRSASGATLSEARRETFSTPALKLESHWPEAGPHPLKPVIFLRFNQDIQTRAVVEKLRLLAGSEPLKLREASSQEVLLDDRVAALSKEAGPKRWLAAVATQELRPGQSYTVEIPAGTPSAEGPLLTKEPQSFNFSTYDPLSIVWKTDHTVPMQTWSINFNNGLNSEKFRPEWVRVEPELPGIRVQAQGSSLSIRGRSKGRSSYQVVLSPELLDIFGQKLGHEERFTVKVGPAEPQFIAPSQSLVVLDPRGPRSLGFTVLNHKRLRVQAWKVDPSDWPDFLKYLQNHRSNLKDLKIPGRQTLDTRVETRAQEDEETQVEVDLQQALGGDLGHLMVRVEPDPPPPEDWQRQPYVGWVQSTQLGLDAMADGQELVGWVSDLHSGRSTPGVQLQLWPGGSQANSDADGLAHLPLGQGAQLLLARKGEDVALLPRDFYYWGSSTWNASSPSDTALFHVLDDRQLYRPGETVSLKGWVRLQRYGPKGDLEATPNQEVSYRLIDSQGNEISTGKAPVGGLGGFTFELKLPKTMNLGHARVEIVGNYGGATQHTFRVEEFRRPEFEVAAEANPGSSHVGSSSVLSASASYFSGGPLANANVRWSVSATPTSYSPPGWDEYTFGTWTPWWNYRCWWDRPLAARATNQVQEGRTDSKGKAELSVDFLSVSPPRPHTLQAEATVQDVNRQTWTSQTSVLVHPARVYVGLKSQRTFVEKGEPLKLSLVVTDLDGKAVSGKPCWVRAHRLDWEGFGEVQQVDVVEKQVTSAGQAVDFELPTGQGGTYQVEALVQDDDNRSNTSQLTLWVAGGKQPPSRGVEQESLPLVPDRKEYAPGDTANVLVQAPFAPAELTVTTRRNGLASVRRVSAPEGTATLKIPLEEVHIPGLHLQVEAVGKKARSDANGQPLKGSPERPAYASGGMTLTVSRQSRTLQVEVIPEKPRLKPGGTTEVLVKLRDHRNQPVQGEVCLMMVDEAVLALTGYSPTDPLNTFCTLRSPDVSDSHLRQFLVLQRAEAPPEEPANEMRGKIVAGAESEALMSAPSGGGAPPPPPAPAAAPQASMEDAKKDDGRMRQSKAQSPPRQQPTFQVRSNFTPLALFEPSLRTDAQGSARVKVKLPDNLTRYRLIALAASGVKQFGKGESNLVARLPLALRPSPPRFLNFGDRCQLPVVVQNQSDVEQQVEFVCRASNARLAQGAESAGYAFSVPANDRVEVQIPCSAEQAGTARFQLGLNGAEFSDAAEVSLPVWTPATTEAFATYGVIDQGATVQPLEMPKDIWPQFGGLSVTTTSTALSELTDAFLYLASYPFECSEQISSRVLSAAALKDVLTAFKAPGMASAEELKASMQRDLERLRGQQNDDGGWDYWVRNKPSLPYLSVHVAHTLVRVRQKGFEVDPSMLERALVFLQNIESHIPSSYGPQCRRAIRAYAVYVLRLAGRPDQQRARQIAREVAVDKLGFEVIAWLMPTLHQDPSSRPLVEEMLRYLDNHVTQTASAANFSESYSDQGYLVLHSDRRDDGLLLESLIEVRPKHPIIPKLVRGLLDHRKAGRWENTQENCWVLLALDRYFHAYESVTPDFVARLWLGDRFAGEQRFRGREKDEKRLKLPLSEVKGNLILAKEGPGRLYYRVGLDYAPRDLKQAAADYGFSVQREYTPMDDNRDVSRDADGIWHIKAGSLVKVNLTMHAPSRRYHVALVDPLPAGLEAVNPGLRGAESRAEAAPSNRYDGWWSWYWYEHQNLRDERVEAFTTLLWEGVYTYSYVARATTPGNFVVPPAKAEEMYHPETFGRSASDRVIVE